MRLKDRGQICSCMAGAFVNWRTVCGGHAKSTMRSRWNHSTKKHCIASVHRSQFDALRQSDLGQITFERASWKAIGARSTILLSLRSSEEHEAITSREERNNPGEGRVQRVPDVVLAMCVDKEPGAAIDARGTSQEMAEAETMKIDVFHKRFVNSVVGSYRVLNIAS